MLCFFLWYVRKHVKRYVRKLCQKICQKACQKICQKICQKECQKICQKECPKICQKECQKICQGQCQKICQKKMSDRMTEDVCYGSQGKCLWVMLHKTKNFAIENAAKLMLCHLMWRTAANTCGSTFRAQASEVGLAAMSELLVERPATIFIGTSSRELGMCGAMSWLQLDLSASTCAWGRLALRMLAIVCSLCQRLWREFCGMWRTEGGLFQMRRASKSWSVLLGCWSAWVANQCCAEKRGRGHSGMGRASWFVRAMRCIVAAVCSLAWHLGTQLLFWRGCLMHAVCVCVCVATGALHLWTQLLLGGAVWCNRMQL